MRCFILFLLLSLVSTLQAQSLVRKAGFGIIPAYRSDSVVVDSVIANLTAASLGLKKNDVILSINSSRISDQKSFASSLSGLRTGDAVLVTYFRNNKIRQTKGKAVMKPLETSEIANITYDWVKFRNGYLRTIVRHPKTNSNSPCILLIPGYGCGSIENYSQSYNGKLMDEWIRHGYAVVTIEKSGMGDSYGCAPCADVDLATDIESFDAGYRYMKTLKDVDTSSLFIWGHSLGGMIAPEIAKRHRPRGVMVFGTVFRPWSEFLLEMHRVQKPLLQGLSYVETENFIRRIHNIYYEFFVLKKTPEELYQNPAYKDLVESDMEYSIHDELMWGRHWRFWQQIDSLNLADSWRKTACPVLIINGTTDYEQCAPVEPILIEQTVNGSHTGFATRVEIADLDHFMMSSKTREEAVINFNTRQYANGNFNKRIAEETVQWLYKQCRKS